MKAQIRSHIDVLFLVVVVLAFGGVNLLWTSHAVNANQTAQARQAAVSKAAERSAGQVLERKLCATLGQLAALKPPSRADVKKGQPYPPSFSYEDNLHATLAQLGTDLGCRP